MKSDRLFVYGTLMRGSLWRASKVYHLPSR